MKLIAHIIIRFALPIAICVLLMVGISLGILAGKVKDWTGSVETHMLNEERSSLVQRTINLGRAIQMDFQHTLNDIMLAKDYAEGVLNGSIPTSGHYGHYNAITGPTPPTTGGMKYSSWYNRANSNTATEPWLVSTSSFDNAWRPISKSTTKYSLLFYGSEDGFFRSFPFLYTLNFPTWIFYCVKTQSMTTGYTPVCRKWYAEAKENSTQVLLTEPYVDAVTGNVLITAAKAVLDISGTVRGVVGLDLSIQTIESLIFNATLLVHGYTFLMARSGQLVIHPNIPRVRTVPILVLQSEKMNDAEWGTFRDKLIPTMYAEGTGQFTFSSHLGETWVGSFSRINGTDYVLVGVVPLSDITAATDELRSSSKKVIVDSIIALIVVGLFLLGVSIFINWKISTGITKPLQELQDASHDVAKGELEVSVENIEVNCGELENIQSSFGVLIKAVRTANEHYMMAHAKAAEQSYRELEVHLKELNYLWGLSTVYNNLAVALSVQLSGCRDERRKQEMLVEARSCFEKSISIAGSFLSGSSSEPSAVPVESNLPVPEHLIRVRIADRYRNLGDLLAKDPSTVPDAISALQTSIAMHQGIENSGMGVIHATGALAMLSHEAFAEIGTLYNSIAAKYVELSSNPSRTTPAVLEDTLRELELASFYYAKALHQYEDYKGAVQCLNYLLALRKEIPEALLMNVLKILADCHHKVGNESVSASLRQRMAALRPKGYGASVKCMIFVLDVSGSMSGSRISTCRSSMHKIIDQYSNPSDSAALITFSSSVKTVQNFITLDPSGANIFKQKINRETTPGGRTAFYDALSEAVRMRAQKGDVYIISLTDGSDNCSQQTPHQVAEKYRRNSRGRKLFIITVGRLENFNDIRLILDASEGSKHIPADSLEGISAAFETVAADMSLGGIEA